MSIQNDADKNPEVKVLLTDVVTATDKQLRPAFVCSQTVVLLTSLLSMLLLAFIAVTLVLTLQVSHPPAERSNRYNLTTQHLTDGESVLTSPVLDPVGRSYDDNIEQGNPFCTHVTNADYASSTTYSSSYRAIRAFQGSSWSWCSKKLYHSDFALQWINVTFNHPTKVVSISFQGASSYPENTPTRYQLQGKNPSTHEWTSLMTAQNPSYKKHNRRSHNVNTKKQREFKEYSLVFHQTIWLEKGWNKGYVQMSFLEMCWD